MISVEDWAEIRRLHRAEKMPVRAIARKLGISRNTVRRAVASDAPPKYQRAAKGSIVDAVEPQIRELLEQWPDMPATVIAERIGWSRSLTVLKGRVRELRPAFQPVDPASRTVYEPGELAQCDLWFPPAEIPLGFGQTGSPPVLVMVCGYSRWISARMLPSRNAADLIAGHWRLLTGLGAVPKALVWDNEGAVRTLQARPADRLDADKSRMLGIPPISPPGWWKSSLRLPRDHYVRIDTCDYSVHPLAVGRRVEVAADLDQVLVTCDGTEVARHTRCWAKHQTLTDPTHAAAATTARATINKPEPAEKLEVEMRSLDTYDRIFGVIDGGLGQGVA
ncbi:Mu transposase domain-containing protein [Streptomyces aureoversilis]|uniref:Helix-turn-helix domain-containing protein n=1 Tax=Streptomyces aureoversilis TaxID=67277 RepID=A0ABW0ABH5_9ACTN